MSSMRVQLRDSGVPWIGLVREDWDVTPAKALFAPRNQKSRLDDVHLTPSQQYGVLPQEEYMEITGNKVVLNLAGSDSMKHVEPGDFVIHLRSFQGGIEHSAHRGKVSMAYTVLSPRERVHAGFYRWALKSPTYIQALQSTTDQLRDGQSIKYGQFGTIPLPKPPLDEQRAIAEFLDRETAQIDSMVDAQERLVGLLQERHDSAWSVYLNRLTGEAPTLPLRRLIRSIVDGPFGSSLTSAHYSDDGARVIRLGNIGVAEFKDTDRAYIPIEYAEQLSAHSVVPGDVVVAGLGDERMPLGRATVVPDIGPAIVKADCYRVRPSIHVTGEYLAWALSAPPTREQIALLSRGSTRQRLNTSIVRNVQIPVPPRADQERVVADYRLHASRINAMIAKARESIALMRERRSALISAAVTGRIDVRTGVEQVEGDLQVQEAHA